MSLQTWQDGLVLALTSEVPVTSSLTSSAGFVLTRRVQREWRAFRIRSSLPLTCRLLGPRCAAALDSYLDAVREPSSFFLREAEQFAVHCRFGETAAQGHVASVVRFELAMLHGAQARAGHQPDVAAGHVRGAQRVLAHWAADLIPFRSPPEQVLMAATSVGWPSPSPSGHYPLLCTPLACRLATAAEEATFERVRCRAAPSTLVLDATARSLLDAGALVLANGVDP